MKEETKYLLVQALQETPGKYVYETRAKGIRLIGVGETKMAAWDDLQNSLEVWEKGL